MRTVQAECCFRKEEAFVERESHLRRLACASSSRTSGTTFVIVVKATLDIGFGSSWRRTLLGVAQLSDAGVGTIANGRAYLPACGVRRSSVWLIFITVLGFNCSGTRARDVPTRYEG
jgi:hypothetical protein